MIRICGHRGSGSFGTHLVMVPPTSFHILTLLHSERPNLHAILVFLSAIGLKVPDLNLLWVDSESFQLSSHWGLKHSNHSTMAPLYMMILIDICEIMRIYHPMMKYILKR